MRFSRCKKQSVHCRVINSIAPHFYTVLTGVAKMANKLKDAVCDVRELCQATSNSRRLKPVFLQTVTN